MEPLPLEARPPRPDPWAICLAGVVMVRGSSGEGGRGGWP